MAERRVPVAENVLVDLNTVGVAVQIMVKVGDSDPVEVASVSGPYGEITDRLAKALRLLGNSPVTRG